MPERGLGPGTGVLGRWSGSDVSPTGGGWVEGRSQASLGTVGETRETSQSPVWIPARRSANWAAPPGAALGAPGPGGKGFPAFPVLGKEQDPMSQTQLCACPDSSRL